MGVWVKPQEHEGEAPVALLEAAEDFFVRTERAGSAGLYAPIKGPRVSTTRAETAGAIGALMHCGPVHLACDNAA
eukprot:10884492-Alexandrium_andersonii.AAC.1